MIHTSRGLSGRTLVWRDYCGRERRVMRAMPDEPRGGGAMAWYAPLRQT